MINIAVIGCGRWGPNHIRNFNKLMDCKVVAAVDLLQDRLSYVSDLYPGIRTEQEYKLMLDDPEVHAVVVATPTSTHFPIVRDALLAGKHVLCEKPLCETNDQAQELIEIASSKQLTLMVGHVFLFNAGILEVKRLIDAGELGKLHYLSSIRTNLGPIRTDVNAAFDLASHDISIINWLLGREPEWVSAVGASFLQEDKEDVVFISLRYPENVAANIQASWLNPKKVRQLNVVGNKRMLTWDDLEINSPIAIYDKGANANHEYNDFGDFLRINMWEGDVRLPKIRLEEPLRAQSRYFLDAVLNGTVPEKAGGKFALGVVKVLEAISESVKMDGSPVKVSS